jgi:AcrR family transcriptional regulator
MRNGEVNPNMRENRDVAGRRKQPPVVPSTARGRITRQRLVEAAILAIGEKGIAETRVAEITRRVGCGYGTFYKYFSSKIDLVRQVMTEVYDEIHRESFPPISDQATPEELVRVGITSMVEVIDKHRNILLALERAVGLDSDLLALRDKLLHRDVEELERRIHLFERAGYGLGLDPFAVSLALNSMVEEMSRRWLFYEDRISEEVFIDTIVGIFMAIFREK